MENFDFSNINFTQQKSYKKDVREIPLFIDFNKLMNVIDDIVCQLPKHVLICYASFIINGCLKCLSKVTLAYRNPQNRKENLNAIYDDIPILEVAVKHLIDNSKFYIKFKNNKVKSLPSYLGLKLYNSYKLILKLMKQISEKTYIADEGKVFQRTFDGFNKINPPIGYFSNLTLGEILVDSKGNKLETPIPDKIQYYEEIELPTNDLDTQEPTETVD